MTLESHALLIDFSGTALDASTEYTVLASTSGGTSTLASIETGTVAPVSVPSLIGALTLSTGISAVQAGNAVLFDGLSGSALSGEVLVGTIASPATCAPVDVVMACSSESTVLIAAGLGALGGFLVGRNGGA